MGRRAKAPIPKAEADRSPIIVSLRTVSEYIDLSVTEVSRLCRAGALPQPPRRGAYELRATVRAYVLHLRGYRGQSKERVTDAYQNERTRLTRHKADMAEIERRRVQGELVPLTDVNRAWATVVTALRMRLLSIPTKLAARMALARNAVEAQALITDAINECLEELSRVHVEALPSTGTTGRYRQTDDDDLEATNEADG